MATKTAASKPQTFTCIHCGKQARTVNERNCPDSPTARHEAPAAS